MSIKTLIVKQLTPERDLSLWRIYTDSHTVFGMKLILHSSVSITIFIVKTLFKICITFKWDTCTILVELIFIT